jgi:hypothetical protein
MRRQQFDEVALEPQQASASVAKLERGVFPNPNHGSKFSEVAVDKAITDHSAIG